jgi:hypothetical protein
MTSANLTYIEIISNHYPDIQVSSPDDGSVYETITLVSGEQLPPKEDLDNFRLGDLRSLVWKDVQRCRDFRKAAGVKVGDYWFHSDDTSRIQHLGLVMFGANLPPGIMWKTMSGEFVQMTQGLAQQIFGAIATSDVTVFGIAEQHHVNINASLDPANYDYTTGWPPIYGE